MTIPVLFVIVIFATLNQQIYSFISNLLVLADSKVAKILTFLEEATEFEKYRSVGIDRIYGTITIGAGIIKECLMLLSYYDWGNNS
jgi:hypothetical protein